MTLIATQQITTFQNVMPAMKLQKVHFLCIAILFFLLEKSKGAFHYDENTFNFITLSKRKKLIDNKGGNIYLEKGVRGHMSISSYFAIPNLSAL